MHRLLQPDILTAVFCVCAGGWLLREYWRRKTHRLLACLFGIGSGIAGLVLLHIFSGAFALPLTVFTVSVSAAGGIPAVILLCVMQMLCGG